MKFNTQQLCCFNIIKMDVLLLFFSNSDRLGVHFIVTVITDQVYIWTYIYIILYICIDCIRELVSYLRIIS